jgi:hypothetical protein
MVLKQLYAYRMALNSACCVVFKYYFFLNFKVNLFIEQNWIFTDSFYFHADNDAEIWHLSHYAYWENKYPLDKIQKTTGFTRIKRRGCIMFTIIL